MEEVDSERWCKGRRSENAYYRCLLVCMLYYKQEASLGALSGSNYFPHFLLSGKWE